MVSDTYTPIPLMIGAVFHTACRTNKHLRLDGDVWHAWMSGAEDGCGNDVRVDLEDVCGDLNDLLDSPITLAEEAEHEGEDAGSSWTFYRLGTAKGIVTLRFLGESNGYYSTAADVSVRRD